MTIKEDLTAVNFTPNGMKEIRGIVIHSMWGTFLGSVAWFRNTDSRASAHYLISQEGEIRQMVADKDMAWHAGIYDEPIPEWLLPNPNFYCLGIEFEDRREEDWPYPDAQRKAGAWLVGMLMDRYSIPKDHVVLHKDLNPSRRRDPVGEFSFDWLFDKIVSPKPPVEGAIQRKQFVIDAYLALRENPPNDDEIKWRLQQMADGMNPKELLEAIASGDAGFYKRWIEPELKRQQLGLENACNTRLTEKEAFWQSKFESAKYAYFNTTDAVTLILAGIQKVLGRFQPKGVKKDGEEK